MNEKGFLFGLLALLEIKLVLYLVLGLILLVVLGLTLLFAKSLFLTILLVLLGIVVLTMIAPNLKESSKKFGYATAIIFILAGGMIGVIQPFTFATPDEFSSPQGTVPHTTLVFKPSVEQLVDTSGLPQNYVAYCKFIPLPTSIQVGVETPVSFSWSGGRGSMGAPNTVLVDFRRCYDEPYDYVCLAQNSFRIMLDGTTKISSTFGNGISQDNCIGNSGGLQQIFSGTNAYGLTSVGGSFSSDGWANTKIILPQNLSAGQHKLSLWVDQTYAGRAGNELTALTRQQDIDVLGQAQNSYKILEWTVNISPTCTPTQHLENNICVENEVIPPEPICVEGSSKCNGNKYQLCAGNTWIDNGVIIGKCGVTQTINCVEGTKKCEGKVLSICTNNTYVSHGTIIGECGAEATTPPQTNIFSDLGKTWNDFWKNLFTSFAKLFGM